MWWPNPQQSLLSCLRVHGRIDPTSQHFETNRRKRTFAGLDALTPGVLKLWIADVPAIFEPGTAAHTTTKFAGFLDRATDSAYPNDCSRGYGVWGSRDWFHICRHVVIIAPVKIAK